MLRYNTISRETLCKLQHLKKKLTFLLHQKQNWKSELSQKGVQLNICTPTIKGSTVLLSAKNERNKYTYITFITGFPINWLN